MQQDWTHSCLVGSLVYANAALNRRTFGFVSTTFATLQELETQIRPLTLWGA